MPIFKEEEERGPKYTQLLNLSAGFELSVKKDEKKERCYKIIQSTCIAQRAKTRKKIHFGKRMYSYCLPQRPKSTFFEIFSAIQNGPDS